MCTVMLLTYCVSQYEHSKRFIYCMVLYGCVRCTMRTGHQTKVQQHSGLGSDWDTGFWFFLVLFLHQM